MAFTADQESQILNMLANYTSITDRSSVTPDELTSYASHMTPSYWLCQNGDTLVRLANDGVCYALTSPRMDNTFTGAMSATNNHIVSSKQVRDYVTQQNRAVETRFQQSESNLNASISRAERSRIKGWEDGLESEFGSIPAASGASSLMFKRPWRNPPLVHVQFWGDVNPARFSQLTDGQGRVVGVRLSATFSGVYMVIGRPA